MVGGAGTGVAAGLAAWAGSAGHKHAVNPRTAKLLTFREKLFTMAPYPLIDDEKTARLVSFGCTKMNLARNGS